MAAAAPAVLRSRFGQLALLALALCLIELVALIFLSALNFFGPRSWAWRITYLVSCVAAVAILPTNFFLAIGIGAAFAMHKVLDRGPRAPGTLAGTSTAAIRPKRVRRP